MKRNVAPVDEALLSTVEVAQRLKMSRGDVPAFVEQQPILRLAVRWRGSRRFYLASEVARFMRDGMSIVPEKAPRTAPARRSA